MLGYLLSLDLKTILAGLGGVGGLFLVVYYHFFGKSSPAPSYEKEKAEIKEKEREIKTAEKKVEALEVEAEKAEAESKESDLKAEEMLINAERVRQQIEAEKKIERELLAKQDSIRTNIEGMTSEQVTDEFKKRGY